MSEDDIKQWLAADFTYSPPVSSIVVVSIVLIYHFDSIYASRVSVPAC